MKEDLTEIVFILDKSGSMEPLTNDTIGGYNAYIKSQQEGQGEAYLTTVLFSDEHYYLHDHVNIRDVQPITHAEYFVGGCTALLDTIGDTINRVGYRLSNTPEEERPAHVIFVITTDGYENASSEYTRDQIKQMIQHQQEKYSWEFLFLGTGIDAYQEAASFGLGGAHAMSVAKDSVGTKSIYEAVTYASNALRVSGGYVTLDSLGDSWKVGDVGAGK